MCETIPPVLALDVTGNPDRWITYEDVAYYEAKDLIQWKQGLKDYVIRGGINRDGERSTMDINTIVAVKSNSKSATSSKAMQARYNRPSLTNKALFRRDGNQCAYCGNYFHKSELTRDHVIPTSRGGPNKWENVVTSCGGCNKAKSDYLLKDIDMKLQYQPYCPSKAEYLILMNKNILPDQEEFLLKVVARVSPESRLLKNNPHIDV